MLELLLTLFMLPKGWFSLSLSLLLVLHDHNVITHLKTFFFYVFVIISKDTIHKS